MSVAQTDTELVTLAQYGDKAAFSLLVKRYQSMTKRIAIGMVANEDIAQELAQEALLQAYLSLNHLRDAKRFKNWLYSIVLNLCRNYLRDRTRNFLSLEAIAESQNFDILSSTKVVPDPQQLAEEHELHELILEAVNTLSPKNRMATLLFYQEQLTMQEVAASLGISIVAAKGRLHKARNQLRSQLMPSGQIKSINHQDSQTMIIDASFLKPGYRTNRKEQFYAEFYPDGKLAHFGYYINKKPYCCTISLSQDSLNAKVEFIKGEQTIVIAYPDGIVTEPSFAQEQSTESERFRRWVESYIRRIYDDVDGMACSFCGRNHKQVEALISGPMMHIGNDYVRLFICNDCVKLCNEILEEMPEKAKS